MNKTSFASFFKDKTVTLQGLGLLGRGVGDAAFLAHYCKRVFVTDTKSAEELHNSVDSLKEHKNIEFFLGRHDTRIFESIDFVIKGAGVRLDNPYIAHARQKNIPVYMSTALFAHLSSIPLIGVTGTRGKTTTTCMVASILQHAGKKVLLGGNIRGVSTLALLPQADQFDVGVLELDSWQLQGFDDLRLSPSISIFTNFYPDHMNYYDADMKRYLQDKTAIFRYQKSGDFLVTTQEVIDHNKLEPPAGVILAPPLPTHFTLKIPGKHNRTNAALAKAAVHAYGIDHDTIDEALQAFAGVEGRLQLVGTWKERTFYNDNNATTQEATLAALSAFPASSIVLICGGTDKGLPIDRMVSVIADNKIRCVLMKGNGSDRVLKLLPNLPVVSTMRDAVKTATDMSKPGDHIILSPGFSSFSLFKNEYDRNDQFMDEIRGLISHD